MQNFNLVCCATQALNGLIGCGVPQDWSIGSRQVRKILEWCL